jgi:acyl dehydratase
MGGGMGSVGTFNPAMIVDGGREITLHGPIPIEGSVKSSGKVTGIYDKGSGAVIESTSQTVDAKTGEPRWDIRSWFFVRGEGGFGGDRGPSGQRNVPPERDPDHVVSYQVRPDQALLYRLNGDRNPLHSDPSFAKMAGFERPILHGLCTYGFTGRALLHALAGSDPARFVTMEGRFSKPVMPGDTLNVKMWVDGNEAVYVTETQDKVVAMDQGRFVFK